MRTAKSTVAVVVALVLAVVLIAGCARGSDDAAVSGEPKMSGEITHWVWGDYEIKGAAAFNQYYPDIEVNYVSVASDEYTTKLQSTIASGATMPEVVNLEMTPRGLFVNIDAWERLEAEPYNLDREKLVPFSVPLIQNNDGEIVSVQIDNCVGGIIYDRALAEQYLGTDDPDELEQLLPTLDDFVEVGEKVAQESGGEQFLFSGVTDAFSTISALHTSEPFVVDQALNLEPTILPTYEYIEKFVADGSIGPYTQWTPAWNASFTSGDVLFYGGPSWFLSFVIETNDPDSEGRWGLMTPPGGGFSWGGTAYAIPEETNDENKMMAWTYIEWFTMSMEGAESFVSAHQTPSLYLPAYETDIYAPRPDPYYGGQDILGKLLEISENPKTQVRPMTKYDQSIIDSNTAVLNELAQGMSAEAALQMLKDDVLSKHTELSDASNYAESTN